MSTRSYSTLERANANGSLFKPKKRVRDTPEVAEEKRNRFNELMKARKKVIEDNTPIFPAECIPADLSCPERTNHMTFGDISKLNTHLKDFHLQRLEVTRGRPSKGGPKAAKARYREKIRDEKAATKAKKVLTPAQVYQKKYYEKQVQEREDNRNRKEFVEQVEDLFKAFYLTDEATSIRPDPIAQRALYNMYVNKISSVFGSVFKAIEVPNTPANRLVVVKLLLAGLALLFPHYISNRDDNALAFPFLCVDESEDFDSEDEDDGGRVANSVATEGIDDMLNLHFLTINGRSAKKLGMRAILGYLHLMLKNCSYDAKIIENRYNPFLSLFNNNKLV